MVAASVSDSTTQIVTSIHDTNQRVLPSLEASASQTLSTLGSFHTQLASINQSVQGVDFQALISTQSALHAQLQRQQALPISILSLSNTVEAMNAQLQVLGAEETRNSLRNEIVKELSQQFRSELKASMGAGFAKEVLPALQDVVGRQIVPKLQSKITDNLEDALWLNRRELGYDALTGEANSSSRAPSPGIWSRKVLSRRRQHRRYRTVFGTLQTYTSSDSDSGKDGSWEFGFSFEPGFWLTNLQIVGNIARLRNSTTPSLSLKTAAILAWDSELFVACSVGDFQTVRTLFVKGNAFPNSVSPVADGWSLLHVRISYSAVAKWALRSDRGDG